MGWLNRERLTVYPRIIIGFYLLVLAYFYLAGSGLTDVRGDPIGGDFSHYWVASYMALQGESSSVYQPAKFLAAQKQTFGVPVPLVFLYPPTYLLLILPLALLPYLASLGAWLSLTLAGFVLVVRRIAPHPLTVGLALAFTGTLENLIHGQNGFLSALLLGAGLLFVDQAPIAAGIIFALLSFKPHLVVLIPLALVAGRRWRALLSMALSCVGLVIASLLALGADVWSIFLHNLPGTLQVLELGQLAKGTSILTVKMPTLLAALLLVGCPLRLAQVLQAVVMLATASIVVWVWSREVTAAKRAAVTVLCILLFPPYEFLYDLVILGLALAWMGWQGVKEGWRPGEQVILVLGFLTPILVPIFTKFLNFQITPLVLALLLAVALKEKKTGSVGNRPD
jgi:hypothetical protein